MVEWKEWPKTAITEDFITKEMSQLFTKVTSSTTRELITRNEPIRVGSLVQPGDHGLLATLITPGMRAFTINIAQGASISALVAPNDYVDIVVADRKAANSTAYTGKTVVRKVKVIAVDATLHESSEHKDATPPKSITLEVSPPEAEKLTAALKDNMASISLYSASDHTPKTAEAPEEHKATDDLSTIKIIRRNEVTNTSVKN
jgi:pilus assembly protein CpaB